MKKNKMRKNKKKKKLLSKDNKLIMINNKKLNKRIVTLLILAVFVLIISKMINCFVRQKNALTYFMRNVSEHGLHKESTSRLRGRIKEYQILTVQVADKPLIEYII